MRIFHGLFVGMIHSSLVRCFTTLQRPVARQSFILKRLDTRPFSYGRLHNNEKEQYTERSGVDTTDALQEYRNENNVRDQVFSAISQDGSVKVTACTARNLLNDMMLAHTMTATPADALGRAVVCALMMSNGMQNEQTVQLTLDGMLAA